MITWAPGERERGREKERERERERESREREWKDPCVAKVLETERPGRNLVLPVVCDVGLDGALARVYSETRERGRYI